MFRRNEKGFTLIELLVVIAIIGLLASVVLLALGNARSRARDARKLSDIRQIQTALELYADQNSSYPPSTTTFTALSSSIGSALAPAFIQQLPTWPGGVCGSSMTTVTNNYSYRSNSATAPQRYALQFCLDNAAAGSGLTAGNAYLTEAGLTNTAPTGY